MKYAHVDHDFRRFLKFKIVNLGKNSINVV